MSEPFIGKWSNGEPIDITGVDLVIPREEGQQFGAVLQKCYAAANDGMFDAIYHFAERRSNGTYLFALARVEESFPPMTPQCNPLGPLGNNARLPMMDKYGYSVALEAAQRKREWAELLLGKVSC